MLRHVLVALFAVAVAFLGITARRVRLFSTPGILPSSKCSLHGAKEFPGVEDMTVFAENDARITLIASYDDRVSTWLNHSAYLDTVDAFHGGLVEIRVSKTSGTVGLWKVPVLDFPEGVAFAPHGLFLSRNGAESLLYVINHALTLGGERIEIFDVRLGEHGAIEARYKRSLQLPIFAGRAYGVLNDLVVIGDHVYVTIWKPSPPPDYFPRTSAAERLFDTLRSVHTKSTFVLQCPLHPNPGDDCRPFSTKLHMANGIQRNARGDLLVVNDLGGPTLHIHRIAPGGAGLRESVATIPLHYAVDNIEVFSDNGFELCVTGGSIGSIPEAASLMHNAGATAAGGVSLICCRAPFQTTLNVALCTEQQLVMQRDHLSGISVGVALRTGEGRNPTKAIAGSWLRNGVLVCPI